ncbi:MAG: hydrogenase expression/formation protein [Gammaproteobacteria bacterium]|nr:hydrogenase expression/formation protein [Gammaproteobacteria bacterium]
MSTLDAISVETEPFVDINDGSGAQAILREIERLLEHLIDNGEEGVIDIKTIPLSLHEHEQLHYVLGRGELTATLNSMGKSIVHETAIAGVWRTIHYNDDGDVIADLIEVTTLPEILKSDLTDMQNALDELRKRIETEQPLIV